VRFLNELEYIDGKIWANVYTSDDIVIINPKDGRIQGVVDCRGLLPEKLRTPVTDVLNGIAYNPADGKIYLTGKNWPKLYEVRLVEKKK
jgi:glutamine cyclotransferase